MEGYLPDDVIVSNVRLEIGGHGYIGDVSYYEVDKTNESYTKFGLVDLGINYSHRTRKFGFSSLQEAKAFVDEMFSKLKYKE